MNIKSLNLPTIDKIAFKGIENKNSVSNPFVSSPDTFIKTAQDTSTKKEYSYDDIEKMYNSVLIDFLKLNYLNNPILKNVKLEKPKIEISSNPNFAGVASYNFPTNTVAISEKILKEDLFLCYTEDTNSQKTITLGVFTNDKLEEEVKTYKELNIPTKTIKLNEKEKEFFIASSLAHETRHFLQSHLIASADGLSEKFRQEQLEAVEDYNRMVTSYNEALKDIQYQADEAKSLGDPIPVEIKEIIDTQKPLSYMDAKYGQNYKPRNSLDPNTMFKFSILPQDKRAMTIENLYDATHKKIITKTPQTKKDYLSNLLEIDAYNYGFEHICATRKKYAEGVRQIVFQGIANDAQRSSVLGLCYAKENNDLPSTMYI